MFPRLSPHNLTNHCVADPILTGEFSVYPVYGYPVFPNLSHQFVVQFGGTISLPAVVACTTPKHRVSGVIQLSPCTKVQGITAWGVVARMQNKGDISGDTAVSNDVHKTMGEHQSAVTPPLADIANSISSFVAKASNGPARFWPSRRVDPTKKQMDLLWGKIVTHCRSTLSVMSRPRLSNQRGGISVSHYIRYNV